MKNSVVYQLGLRIVADSERVALSWPAGSAYLVDQIRRASSSIVLNFAEGCGRSSRKDRERCFTIARGSAREVQACLDVAFARGIVEAGLHERIVEDCVHVSLALRRFGAG